MQFRLYIFPNVEMKSKIWIWYFFPQIRKKFDHGAVQYSFIQTANVGIAFLAKKIFCFLLFSCENKECWHQIFKQFSTKIKVMGFRALSQDDLKFIQLLSSSSFDRGPFKYYVSKEVGGWGQKMAIFADLQCYLCWTRWVGGPKKAKNMLT